MRAAVYNGPRDLRLESVPDPQAGPGDVKLRVLYNGICGSDLHEYYDGPVTTRTTPHSLTGVQNPVILGDELCGEVVALGRGVEDLALGDLVAVDPLESCGGCLWCLAGQYNHCPLVALHGYNRDGGGLAEYTVVRRSMAHRLGPALTPLAGRVDRAALGGVEHREPLPPRGRPERCDPRRRTDRDRGVPDTAVTHCGDHHL